MDRMSAADRLPTLRTGRLTHLAFGNQFSQGSDRLFDRRLWVDAMLVVEIDVVGAESRNDPSSASRMFAGLLSGTLRPVLDMKPNFVASTT